MVRNSTMEPTFYEDQVGTLYGPTANRIGSNGGSPGIHLHHHHPHHQMLGGGGGGGGLKRSQLTLDLNTNSRQCKRPKLTPLTTTHQTSLTSFTGLTPLLASPDLLKLGTPEFEKLLIAQQDGCIVTTTALPTTAQQQQQQQHNLYYEKTVTEEQEQYARGFVDALNELHHSDSSQEPGGCLGGGGGTGSLGGATYTTLEPPGSVQSTTTDSLLSHQGGLVQIKDEPQTVPSVSSSPPMSPIDMESQERIKLERKRQRNRVAASKCRRRKLERISRLEDKVKLLKGENNDLSQVVNRLREHVSRLKEQVIDHMHSGCQITALPGIF